MYTILNSNGLEIIDTNNGYTGSLKITTNEKYLYYSNLGGYMVKIHIDIEEEDIIDIGNKYYNSFYRYINKGYHENKLSVCYIKSWKEAYNWSSSNDIMYIDNLHIKDDMYLTIDFNYRYKTFNFIIKKKNSTLIYSRDVYSFPGRIVNLLKIKDGEVMDKYTIYSFLYDKFKDINVYNFPSLIDELINKFTENNIRNIK